MSRIPEIRPSVVLAAALCITSGVLTFAALAADEHKPAEHGAPAKAEPKSAAKPAAGHEAKAETRSESKVDSKTMAAAGKPGAPAEAAAAPAPAPAKPAARPAPRPPVPVSASVSPDLRRFTPVTEPAAPRAPAAAAKLLAHAAPGASHTTTGNGITMTVTPVVEDTHAHPPHWSYEGANGPQAWAKLAPEFAACGNGQRQSPIDIRDGMKLDLEPIGFEYRPSAFKVVDNGHTIQANVSGWNSIRLMGRVFRLEQFHFHRPSEEMIDGKQFEMVVHLVHKDSQGRLAVVAVLIEAGVRQPVIQTVLNNLPLEKNQELRGSSNIDLSQLLPASRNYFTYMGSLTTPPCTEDVLWIVMKQPVQATPDQIDLFSRLYPMNARPVQESMGRMIKESN